MTHRIESFSSTLLKEIEPFFKIDSKNCTFFEQKNDSKYFSKKKKPFRTWLTELIFFEKTHRIEPTFFLYSKNWTFFWYHSKNWTFIFEKSLKELIFSSWLKIWTFSSKTHRTELFLKMNHRIELFFFWIRLTEMDIFLEDDAKNKTLISWIWTQGIEPFNFWKWLTELNLFFRDSKN